MFEPIIDMENSDFYGKRRVAFALSAGPTWLNWDFF